MAENGEVGDKMLNSAIKQTNSPMYPWSVKQTKTTAQGGAHNGAKEGSWAFSLIRGSGPLSL